MIQQLSPGETYNIVRVLTDHTDSTTYYCRAIVYKASDRSILATLDLTDNGNRWFSKAWSVPSLNTYGGGAGIIIITSVYTDSGYTTRSQHYDDVQEYLVQQRWSPSVGAGGGGIDYIEVERIIRKVLGEQEKKENIIEEKKPDLIPDVLKKVDSLQSSLPEIVSTQVQRVLNEMPSIEIPEPEIKIDLHSIEVELKDIKNGVRNIKIPVQEKVDLSKIESTLESIVPEIEKIVNRTYKEYEYKLGESLSEKDKELISILTQKISDEIRKKIKEDRMELEVENKNKKRENYLNALKTKYET